MPPGLENALATMAEEILGGSELPLDRSKSFLELRFDSLMLARLVQAIDQTFGLRVSLCQLLGEDSNLSSLASFLAGRIPFEQTLSAPLTEGQLEILLCDQFGGDASRCFNESVNVSLRGPLVRSALYSSLQLVLRRHEALRTTFDLERGCQIIHPDSEVTCSEEDLSRFEDAEQQLRLRQIFEDDALRLFDVAAGPLFRVSLLRLSEDHHVFRFTAHQVVCDSWSQQVILNELAQVYSAHVHDRRAELPGAVRFQDFARGQVWSTQTVSDANVEAYWTQRFFENIPVLSLPLDRQRPQIRSYRGGMCRWLLDSDSYLRLKQLAGEQKCTVFAALLGIFQGLLSRLTGQEDLVVGIPVAGQMKQGNKHLVGHCVNFLPVRARVEIEKPASELMQNAEEELLAALENQCYTLGTLVRKLGIKKDPSRLPLAEVHFSFDQESEENFSGLEVHIERSPKRFVNFDLSLNAIESKRTLLLECGYSSELFEEATVKRWLGYYANLLQKMPDNISEPFAEIDFLPDKEREFQLKKWNNSSAEFPRDACLHALVDQRAFLHPKHTAVRFENRSLTYEQLFEGSNQMGRLLSLTGVCPGSTVAVCLERSIEMPTVLLGVLKAGAAYVPIDPAHPKQRKQTILEDVQPAVILTHRSLAADLPPSTARVIYADAMPDLPSRSALSDPSGKSNPEDLAYIIYTSGSTGKPKGVEIQHRALVNLLCSMRREPGFSGADTLMAVTSLSFDIAALEMFLPLLSGGTLVIAKSDEVMDGAKLLARIRSSGATVMQATPATWRLLLDAGLENCHHLKILCGGEALPRDLADRILRTGAQLWNVYGPTETTIWSSCAEVVPGKGAVPLGRPIANTQFYILDKSRRLLPVGVPGELYIGGEGVARGYRNRLDLTEKSFFPDPFQWAMASRMYKTGDAVRLSANGEFEFLGRLDFQVKVNGFRIELGEVEAALTLHPEVKQCIVTVREDKPGERRLIAYWLPEGTAEPEQSSFRAFLSAKLPSYMIPSIFVALKKFPLQISGKVDRLSLPAPALGSMARADEFAEPRNEVEELLRGIWSEVLKRKDFGVFCNLFRLGADSLQISQIAMRAKQAGLKITPRMLLENQTIASLAKSLEEQNLASAPKTPLRAVSREQYRVRQASEQVNLAKA